MPRLSTGYVRRMQHIFVSDAAGQGACRKGRQRSLERLHVIKLGQNEGVGAMYMYVVYCCCTMHMLTIVASLVQPGLCDVVLEHVLHLVDALDEPG